ncbi:nucleotide sugar dehydrogenase [Caballeronia glebae]|uniref:nucleotide sugar dehydrogenase n=1 Tax=Caballeronia glebae TaxID=1777143 RepID=UPI0038B6F39C
MHSVKRIAVVGLGYVGCPLAYELSKHFDVVGFDTSAARVSELSSGRDRNAEVDSDELIGANWTLSSDPSLAIPGSDVIIVTVPTPITDANVPDLNPVVNATNMIARFMDNGATVIYESTVYPGVTEDVCVPLLSQAQGGKRHRFDFWVGYSPERINPGDKVHTLSSTTKIVSGDCEQTLELVDHIYSKITATYRAQTIKVAEAAKVIENTQRDVNIALMNELSQIFSRLEIDTHDVIDAAASKWNFMRYIPGFVGGHCISVDPYYLTHRSAQVGYIPSLILSAREVNDKMPSLVAERTLKALKLSGVGLDTRVTILGITFKENVPDIRNSKAAALVRELEGWGIDVQVIDPIADPREVHEEYGIKLMDSGTLDLSRAIILAVAHEEFVEGGWDALLKRVYLSGKVVVTDVKGVLDRSAKPEFVTLVRP